MSLGVSKTKAFFKVAVNGIINAMRNKDVYYVHPAAKMIKRAGAVNRNFAASSISCLDISKDVNDISSLKRYLEEDKTYTMGKSDKMIKDHFIAVNISVTDKEEPKNYLTIIYSI